MELARYPTLIIWPSHFSTSRSQGSGGPYRWPMPSVAHDSWMYIPGMCKQRDIPRHVLATCTYPVCTSKVTYTNDFSYIPRGDLPQTLFQRKVCTCARRYSADSAYIPGMCNTLKERLNRNNRKCLSTAADEWSLP